jgi:hypothetical protein
VIHWVRKLHISNAISGGQELQSCWIFMTAILGRFSNAAGAACGAVRRGEISSACDSLAISRRIYAFTTTPHSSLHRWQYRAPQGSLPLLELSRISLLLRVYSAVIPCVRSCIFHLCPALAASCLDNKPDRLVATRM